VTAYDPPAAPRRRESGYKGDGWTVTLPSPGGSDAVLGLDTGLDSLAILRVPNAKWDRGERPLRVHAHADHDETIVIPTGSGTLYQGADPAALAATRFRGPVVLVAPAGVFHHVVMDPDATATGTCFFTVPGTVLVRFADRKPLNRFGKVTFADLPVVSPPAVDAAPWTSDPPPDPAIEGRLAGGATTPAGGATTSAGGATTSVGGSAVRVIGYQQPEDGYVLPLDTGEDSLFVMISRGRSWDRAPVEVDVHSHADVDEFIVIDSGEGYLLNGPDLGSVTLTPFRGPAVIVMPAGAFHRIVRTDDEATDSILVYADRRAVVPRYARIMERTTVVAVADAAPEGVAT
jgi:uncharacterized cupin superfamily protein